MTETIAPQRHVITVRIITILDGILVLGILSQAAFAGGFLGGQHIWFGLHGNLGDLLIILPLASLIVGVVLRRHHPQVPSLLVSRSVVLILVIAVILTGHAGSSLLALHIPAAVVMTALLIRQLVTSAQARKPEEPMTSSRPDSGDSHARSIGPER